MKLQQATGEGERSRERRELHSERCSCTEAAANGVGRGLSEVIGEDAGAGVFSTSQLESLHEHVRARTPIRLQPRGSESLAVAISQR